MRLAILYTRLSGYLAACLRQFKKVSGAEVLVYAWPNQPSAPFDLAQFEDLGKIVCRRGLSESAIRREIEDFKPDAILTSGWIDRGYGRICRSMRQRGVPVIAGCDTQWAGSLRQQVAAATAPMHVRRFIDVMWVTGERQAVLARALGFRGSRLWEGYYACDFAQFSSQSKSRLFQKAASNTQEGTGNDVPSFLYVGRYAPEKGLDTLAAAYSIYQRQVERPWRLVCAGAGPLRDVLLSAGAEDRGFIQPDQLPGLMGQADAFILPSRFEPWGVVAHEAAASGLPLILSDACGAGAHLLRHLGNGYVFPASDAEALADRMVRMTRSSDGERAEMGEASFQLAKQYTPERWALTLMDGIRMWQQDLGP